MSAQRPNFLFIICDDLNTAVEGHDTIPFAPTPNLERLRKRGVTFQNAQNNCSICVPSRNSCLTGLYPHTTGNLELMDNIRNRPLIRDAVSLPRYLQKHGYQTYGAGKVFHGGPKDKEVCWTEYGNPTEYGPMPWDPSLRDGKGGGSFHPLQAWLLESDEIFGPKREYADPKWMKEGRLRFPAEQTFGPLSRVPEGGWRNSDGSEFRYVSETDRDRMPDELTADYGIDVLGREHDSPFFLALGFVRPHTPLYVPDRYFEMFPPESIELPPVLENDLEDCAPSLVANRPYARLRWEIIKQGGEPLWRQWLQAFLASIAFMDDQLGRVFDALEASGQMENTVVIFTSDNGYHMGEKECLFKATLWEESDRVPLVIDAPGVAQDGLDCEAPVSLIDLYPTILELADLPGDPHASSHGHALEGHSLVPLLQHPDLGEWDGPPVALTSMRGQTGVHHSVRSRTHRYTLCQNGEEELYDHTADPHEWHNKAADPEYAEVKAELRAELEALVRGR